MTTFATVRRPRQLVVAGANAAAWRRQRPAEIDVTRGPWPGRSGTRAYKRTSSSVPFHPVPPFAPRLFHDTFDAGMPEPLGGVNAAASACTLTRRALPRLRFAFEKLIVVGLGAPLVLRLTSVTAKLTADGTAMLTVSCAAADTTAAARATMPRTAIRVVSRSGHREAAHRGISRMMIGMSFFSTLKSMPTSG